jgi:hypothetical protein
MKRLLPLAVGLSAAGWVVVWGASPAFAACHHFSVTASPNPVTEGRTLAVTVSRDANLAPSHVDVSTVDETAKAAQDYTQLNRTVSFTSDIQQSFPVPIVSHSTSTPNRTFRLHLSNPGGCAVNPNFVVDPDVRVTIAANGVKPSTGGTNTTGVTTGTAGTSSVAGPAPVSGATSRPAGAPSQLARTGSSATLPLAATALLLIVTGTAAVVMGDDTWMRLRRRTHG